MLDWTFDGFETQLGSKMVKCNANGLYLMSFDEYYQYDLKNSWPKSSRLLSIHNGPPTAGKDMTGLHNVVTIQMREALIKCRRYQCREVTAKKPQWLRELAGHYYE